MTRTLVRDSQARRVLVVLEERFGRWVSIDEIHAHAGSMRLNSRISDLRDRYLIERRQRGPVHEYRLLGRKPAPSEEPSILHGPGGSSDGEAVPRRRRFVPVSARAVRAVGDGADYRFAVHLAPESGAAWSGAGAGLLLGRRAAAAASASSPPAPVQPGEQLDLEAT